MSADAVVQKPIHTPLEHGPTRATPRSDSTALVVVFWLMDAHAPGGGGTLSFVASAMSCDFSLGSDPR